MARRSTAVEPDGTQTMICGLAKLRRLCTLRMKCDHFLRHLKSAMTPSRSGGRLDAARRAASINSLLAHTSTSRLPLTLAIATTEGSLSTIPRPLT